MSGSELLRVLGWVHVHFLWQALLLAGFLALALRLVPSRHTAVRYGLSCATLTLVALAPCLTLALGFVRGSGDALGGQPARPTTAPFTVSDLPPSTPGETPLALEALATDPGLGVETAFPWALSLWLLGVVSLSVANLCSWVRARRLTRHDLRPVPAEVSASFRRLRARLGLPDTIELWESARVTGPLTLGWWRPVVLLPASALCGLSPRELEAVLAHELAHVRRHDYLVNLLQVGIETLFFHHPAVWWISSRIRHEREHCCDDVAVDTCGDARLYAFALTALERSRPTPTFAMPAHGGPLLRRIQRILGAPGAASIPENPSLRGLGTMLTLTLFAASTAYLACAPAQAVAMQQEGRISIDAPGLQEDQGEQLEPTRGLWMGRLDERALRLELRPATDGSNHWGQSIRLPLDTLPPLELGDAFRLTLEREAGELQITGDLLGTEKDADGTGRFTFTPSPAYGKALRKLGYGRLTAKQAFTLGIHDVTSDFARKVRELGPDEDIETLVKFSIHGVTEEFIDGMQARGLAGFDAEALVSMRIHGVSLEYTDAMKGLFGDKVAIGDLVSFRIHGVTPEFAREITAMGYSDVTPDELRSLRIHGVTPELMRAVDSILDERPSLDGLTSLRIHGATPEFMRDMGERFGTAELEDFVRMRIHGVTAGFFDEMATLGVQGTSVDGFVKLRIHGVNAKWVTRQIEAGLTDLSIENLVRRKIRG